MLKVCHVVVGDKPYGALRVAHKLVSYCEGLYQGFVATNHDISPALPGSTMKLPLDFGKTWRPGFISNLGNLPSFRRATRVLEKWASAQSFDIVHFHLPNAWMLANYYRGPGLMVATVHGPLFEVWTTRMLASILAPRVLTRMRAITYVNMALEVMIRKYLRGLDIPVIFVMNGVDRKDLNRSVGNASRDTNEKHVVTGDSDLAIACVGRIERRKGQWILVRAMPNLISKYPRLRCFLVGDGPEVRKIREEARRLGVDKSLGFLGYVENPSNIMAKSDVVVTNLSSELEGVSLVHLEALALGKPIVTRFDKEKFSFFGENLAYTYSDDPVSVANTVDHVLRNLGSWKEKARQINLDRFSWKEIAKRYLEIYAEVKEGRASSL